MKDRTIIGGATNVLLGILGAVVLAAAVGFAVYAWQQRTVSDQKATIALLQQQLQTVKSGQTPSMGSSMEYTSPKGVKVMLYAPVKNAKVVSPVAVIGKIPGNWSSEASFPLELRDAKGAVVAQTTAKVLGDWMTDQPVPFSASLSYSATPTGTGNLVLHKDNPSGQPQNDDSISVPVSF